jgi:hypothetical protein
MESVLKHCAANRKRRLSALPNVGSYIYEVKISGFTRNSIYIYEIIRLRVNMDTDCFSTWSPRFAQRVCELRLFLGGKMQS